MHLLKEMNSQNPVLVQVKFHCVTVGLSGSGIFYTSGKDQIIFVTKEDHETPSSAELMEEDLDDPYEDRGVEHWLLTTLERFFLLLKL